MSLKAFLTLGFTLAVSFVGSTLHAELGERLDRATHVKHFSTHTLQEQEGERGGRIKEYADIDGVVFAVTWEGGALPKFEKILGKHFVTFARHAQSQTRRRGPLVIEVDDLFVVSGGHQRDFRGQALLKSLIPADMDKEAIK